MSHRTPPTPPIFFPNDHRRQPPRRGVTMIELVVSAVLLMTIMTFVTTLCYQVNLVWRDIGHQRIAMGELANQLDRLTRLSPGRAQEELDVLTASATCHRTLGQPRVSGKLIEDDWGYRVVIQIDWKRRYPGVPLELVGWLIPESVNRQPSEAGQ